MKKILLFLLATLLVAGTALGATAYRYDDVVQTVRGDAVGGATISVYKAGTDTLATLYSGVSTALPAITNPTYSSGYGRFFFYAIAGSYDIVISGSNISPYTKSDIRLFGSALVASEVVNDATFSTSTVAAAIDSLASLDHDWSGETASLTTTGSVFADSLTASGNIHIHSGGSAGEPAYLYFHYGDEAGATHIRDDGGSLTANANLTTEGYIISESYISAEGDITAGSDGTGGLNLPSGGSISINSDNGVSGEVLTSTGTANTWAIPGNIQGYSAEASTTTLTAAQSGSVVSNTGAAGTVVYTLPTAVAGMNFRFYSTAAQVITIDPPAGVTIQLGATVGTADTGTISSGALGDSCELFATSATTWIVTRYTTGWGF